MTSSCINFSQIQGVWGLWFPLCSFWNTCEIEIVIKSDPIYRGQRYRPETCCNDGTSITVGRLHHGQISGLCICCFSHELCRHQWVNCCNMKKYIRKLNFGFWVDIQKSKSCTYLYSWNVKREWFFSELLQTFCHPTYLSSPPWHHTYLSTGIFTKCFSGSHTSCSLLHHLAKWMLQKQKWKKE